MVFEPNTFPLQFAEIFCFQALKIIFLVFFVCYVYSLEEISCRNMIINFEINQVLRN